MTGDKGPDRSGHAGTRVANGLCAAAAVAAALKAAGVGDRSVEAIQEEVTGSRDPAAWIPLHFGAMVRRYRVDAAILRTGYATQRLRVIRGAPGAPDPKIYIEISARGDHASMARRVPADVTDSAVIDVGEDGDAWVGVARVLDGVRAIGGYPSDLALHRGLDGGGRCVGGSYR